jgi:anti-sigma-K factor RskA
MYGMNRYQKPELFERLAMEYSLGTLKGRARKRFETLMQQYPYIAATVESHDLQFASLVELLPETKPDVAVWEKINAQINQQPLQQSLKTSYHNPDDIYNDGSSGLLASLWRVFANPGLMGAMLLLVLSSVFLLKLGNIPDATGFSATLMSAKTHKPMAVVQVAKTDMKMTIELMEPVKVPDGMKAVFWCIAKDKEKPMINMGTLAAKGMTEKKLKKSSWKGIVEASEFAVSIEPADAISSASPSGELIFLGKLRALTKT